MSNPQPDVPPTLVREWLDADRLERIEEIPDRLAEFNVRVVFSGMSVHVVKNRPFGPLSVGGQVEVTPNVRPAFRDLPAFDRHQLEARIREQLTAGPVLYYFLDESGENVQFEDAHVIRLERLLYPDGANQQALMDAVFAVAKQLFFLNESIDTLIENVESRR